METERALAHALTLLSGELRNSAGQVVMVPTGTIVAVEGEFDARTALGEGHRVAIAVPLDSVRARTRLTNLCLARFRIASARRRLAAAGATAVRAFAIITATETLFLVYELGGTIQPYVEDYIVLEPPAARSSLAAKRLLRTVSGLSTSVNLVVVVGSST